MKEAPKKKEDIIGIWAQNFLEKEEVRGPKPNARSIRISPIVTDISADPNKVFLSLFTDLGNTLQLKSKKKSSVEVRRHRSLGICERI